MERQYSSIEEDYVVVAPQEAGEQPQEYCVQDESRPRLFSNWGPVIPVGRAVTSLLSSFLDNLKSSSQGGPYVDNVTVEPCSRDGPQVDNGIVDTPPDTSIEKAKARREPVAEPDSVIKLDHTKPRKSIMKQRAISYTELDTEYSLQKFRLHSKDNSTDDYLILKVKTKSASSLSLASPHAPHTEARSLGDRTNYEDLVSNSNIMTSSDDDVLEKDSPAHLPWRKYSDQAASNSPGSGVLLRKQMNNKKSHSLPSQTEILSLDSFHIVSNSLPIGNGSKLPSTLSSNAVSSMRTNSGDTLPSNTVESTLPSSMHTNGTGSKISLPSEREIKEKIRTYCKQFIEYSNWATLLPLLEASGLLDPDTKDKLMNPYFGDHEKGRYFYLKTLPSQGKSAYTTFYECLMQEQEHVGHRTLQEYLCPSKSR